MAEQTIDRVSIQIDASAQKAGAGIDAFTRSIRNMKAAVSGASSELNPLAASMNKLKSAMAGMDSAGANGFLASIAKLKALKGETFSGLASSMGELKRAISDFRDVSGLSSLAAVMNELKGKSGSITSLANAFGKLQNLDTGSIAASMRDITNVAASLGTVGGSLNSMKDFSTGVNALSRGVKKLNGMDIAGLENKVESLTAALKPLANMMERTGGSMGGFGTQLKELTQAMKLANGSVRSWKLYNNEMSAMSGTLKKGWSLTGAVSAFQAAKQVGETIGGFIGLSNKYIEDINLFTVSLGEYAKEGEKFANRLQKALGVNAGEAMQNMGLFQNLATSFGVTSEQAYTLSTNLTQLAYDFASFHNISIEESFLKLQSAIAGELEPIRRIGKDISEARLQQELYDLGIDKSVGKLGRADKALLSYIAIMKQSGNEMHDMARTILTPQNALRVLQNQMTIASREIGNIFIPALTAILPPAIAVVKVIGEMARSIASLLGFEMPEIDYSTGGLAFGDLTEGIGSAGDAADSTKKKLDNLIGGFDELNILQKQTEAKGSGGSSAGGSILGDIKLPSYDMLNGLADSQIDKYTKKVRDFLGEFKNSAGVKTLGNLFDFLWNKGIKPLGEWVISHPREIADMLTAIGVAILTYKLVTGIGKLVTGFLNLKNAVSAGGLLSGLKTLGGIFTNPWALAIAAVAAAITAVGIALWNAHEDAVRADLEGRFGDIALSMEEVQELAEALTTTEYTMKMDIFFDELEALGQMYESVNSLSEQLFKDQWKASMGIEIDLDEYSSNVDSFIQQVQDTVSQQKYNYHMAIELGISDPQVKAEMSEFVDNYLGQAQEDLTRLGKEMRHEVDLALADGTIDAEEAKLIQRYEQEMLQIMQSVADADYKAKLHIAGVEYSLGDLNYDSFIALTKDVQSMIDEQTESAELIAIKNISIAEMAFDRGEITREVRDQCIDVAENSLKDTRVELRAQGTSFIFDEIMNKYKDDFGDAFEGFDDFTFQTMQSAFDSAWEIGADGEKSLFNWTKLYHQIENGFNEALPPAAKSGLQRMLKYLEPTEQEYKKIRDANLTAGQAVPKAISDALTDFNMLRVVTGDTVAIWELIGNTAANDPSVLEVLKQLKAAGVNIPDQVILGLESQNVKLVHAGEYLPEHITRGAQDELEARKTELQGVGSGSAQEMIAGSESQEGFVEQAGRDLESSELTGMQKQLESDKPEYAKTLEEVNTIADDVYKLDENGNSTVYEKKGQGIIGGLWDGIQSAWRDLLTWWKENVKLPDVQTEIKPANSNRYFNNTSKNKQPTRSAEPFSIEVPAFAGGNVADEPTLGLFGEYPGAHSNPEVTAPQSTIYDTVVSANGELVTAMYQMTKQLIAAIAEHQPEIAVDSKGVLKMTMKEANEYRRAHGTSPF